MTTVTRIESKKYAPFYAALTFRATMNVHAFLILPFLGFWQKSEKIIFLFRLITSNGAFAKINGTKAPESSSLWQTAEKVFPFYFTKFVLILMPTYEFSHICMEPLYLYLKIQSLIHNKCWK